MPATYTYNDAIEDAQSVVVKAWEEQPDPAIQMTLMLSIVGRLENLKRSSRRRRPPRPDSAGQAT